MTKKFVIPAVAGMFVTVLTVFGVANASSLAALDVAPISAPASSAVDICKQAQAEYNIQKGEAQAKALSTQMSSRELRALLDTLRARQIEACKNAVVEATQNAN